MKCRAILITALRYDRCVAGVRLRSVMSSIIRRRSGLTADVALATGWSLVQRLVLATKPSHQESIPANSGAHPALVDLDNVFQAAAIGWGRLFLVRAIAAATIALMIMASSRVKSFLMWFRILRRLCPQPHSTTKMASPRVPLSGHLARRPSVFMCPISGSMALRRRRSFFSAGVRPRLHPEIRTRVVSTPWPR